jgi:DNA-binding MarR family transcriptional regulator
MKRGMKFLKKETEQYSEVIELIAVMSSIMKSWRQLMTSKLEETHMKPIHLKILEAVEEHGNIPLSAIAEDSYVTSAWVTNAVNEMTRLGYVKKMKGENDRRTVRLKLTEKGREALEKGRSTLIDELSELLQVLSGQERRELKKLLEKLEGAYR